MAATHLVLLLVLVSANAVLGGPSTFLHDSRGVSLQHIRVANASFRAAEEEETNPCEEEENGNTLCKNCKTVIFCVDKQAYEAPCPEEQICEGNSPTAKCASTSGGGGGGAPQTRGDTNCKCEDGDKGFIADPFDPSSYLLCPSGELKTCSEGKVFNAEEEKCEEGGGEGGSQECTEMGVFPVLPDCKAFYTCFETDGGLESTKETPCEDGKIFSDETKDCQDAPADPGETTCTDFGLVKDNYECNKYLLCVGKDQPPSKTLCCEDGKVFDAEEKGCVEPATTSASVECLGECALTSFGVTPSCAASKASSTASSSTLSSSSSSPSSDSSASTGSSSASTDASSESTGSSGSTGTTGTTGSTGSTDTSSISTVPSTSTSPETPTCTAQGTIPYPGDCTKYYTCRKLASGEWEMREFKCPGNLVFSPSKLYCTLAANVPECA